MKKLFGRVFLVLLLAVSLAAAGMLLSSCAPGTPSESGVTSSSPQDSSQTSSGDPSSEDGTGEDPGSGGGLVNGGNFEDH